MSKARKKARAFVVENRHLGLERLVQETGLRPRQVGRLLAEARPQEGSAVPSLEGGDLRSAWTVAGLVAVATGLVYLPALSHQFVNWDDPSIVLENLNIRRLDGKSLWWMLTTLHTGNWIPLTWLSHALDYRLWGLDPRGHHLTSLLLHAANAALVGLVSLRLLARVRPGGNNLWIAALAGLLFGVHPIHVESVAWVSERKDLLCALFFLLSLLAYLGFASGEMRKRRYPWATLLFFTLALLSKPMAVTLPLVLLLLDAWPLPRLRGRWRPALIEKTPFFALAFLSALATFHAQAAAGAIASGEVLPLAFRVRNALRSIVFYLEKMLVPVDLAPLYPIGAEAVRRVSPVQAVAVLVVIVLTAAAFFAARRGRPAALVAWAYYLVTLAPVLGLVQVGHQLAADRYAYLPSLSVVLLFAAALGRAVPPLAFRAMSLILVGGLGVLCLGQIAVWRDSTTLWERVTTRFPDVSNVAHTNLANAYRQGKRTEEAIREYRRALAIPPPHAFTHDGLGAALLDGGDVEGAIGELRKAIALDPHYAPAHRNLWFAHRRKGSEDEALAAIQQAVRLSPDFAAAWSNLGISYARRGQLAESEDALRRAVTLEPDSPQYLANLATTLGRAGRQDEAIELHRRARRLDPDEPVYAFNLGNSYLERGMTEAAIGELGALVARWPANAMGHARLGEAYRRAGRRESARASFERALAFAPDSAAAHSGLARVFLTAGQLERAREHAAKALSLGIPLDEELTRALGGEPRSSAASGRSSTGSGR